MQPDQSMNDFLQEVDQLINFCSMKRKETQAMQENISLSIKNNEERIEQLEALFQNKIPGDIVQMLEKDIEQSKYKNEELENKVTRCIEI